MTLNLSMCADSITNTNENGLEKVKTAENKRKRQNKGENRWKWLKRILPVFRRYMKVKQDW